MLHVIHMCINAGGTCILSIKPLKTPSLAVSAGSKADTCPSPLLTCHRDKGKAHPKEDLNQTQPHKVVVFSGGRSALVACQPANRPNLRACNAACKWEERQGATSQLPKPTRYTLIWSMCLESNTYFSFNSFSSAVAGGRAFMSRVKSKISIFRLSPTL